MPKPLDIINVMLSAIIGAAMGNSILFKPTDLHHLFESFEFILIIIGFAVNCQFTAKAIHLNKSGLTVTLVALFVLIEVLLVSYGMGLTSLPNGITNIQLRFQDGQNIWLLATALPCLYAINVVFAATRLKKQFSSLEEDTN